MKTIRDPRELAVRCMVEVQRHELLVNQAMARLSWDLPAQDRRLSHELVYGAFRYLPGIELLLKSYLSRAEKLPPLCRALLAVSTYQLLLLRIPDYAVVNEASRLTGNLGIAGLKPMVNGVLRNVGRTGKARWEAMAPADRLLPKWLKKGLEEQWGVDTVASWLPHWEVRPKTSFWCLPSAHRPAAEQSPYLPHAYLCDGELPPQDLQNGYIQNESAQFIAALCLALKPSHVLDLCAAPGGKTCYIAAFGDVDRLVAVDASESRTARLRENCRRLGLHAEISVALAEELTLDDRFDVVLVDAPCTGLGICGRHPEIKVLRQAPADAQLRHRQKALMECGWKWVKPGGYLVYAVCSVDRSEVPPPPEHAEIMGETLDAWIPAGFPLQRDARGFWIAPSVRLDGFCGALLQKATGN